MFQHVLTINNSDLTIARLIKAMHVCLPTGGLFGRLGRHAIEARIDPGFVWSNPNVVDTKWTNMSRSSNVKHGLQNVVFRFNSPHVFLITDRALASTSALMILMLC